MWVTVHSVSYHQRAGKFSGLCFKRIQNSKRRKEIQPWKTCVSHKTSFKIAVYVRFCPMWGFLCQHFSRLVSTLYSWFLSLVVDVDINVGQKCCGSTESKHSQWSIPSTEMRINDYPHNGESRTQESAGSAAGLNQQDKWWTWTCETWHNLSVYVVCCIYI